MRSLRLSLLASFGLLSLAACAPPAPSPPAASATAADEAAVRTAGVDAWNDAYNARDLDKVVALYTDDAILMPPDAPIATGSSTIREFFVKDIADARTAGITVKDTGGSVSVTGDTAWHIGTFAANDASGKTVGTGKYVEQWRKRDGKWLMYRDIWNNDAPPTPEPAKK